MATHATRGARVSIDNAGAHATIRATQAQGLRCGLCRCRGVPVSDGPLLVHRAMLLPARLSKETGRDP
ncbi:MAG TPA: hypothetical protein VLQ80_00115 [Candidatus Saccharimonadia bacterium]|nr:hypothetical protein [Candidatus Saccharimonadia bacterium]